MDHQTPNVQQQQATAGHEAYAERLRALWEHLNGEVFGRLGIEVSRPTSSAAEAFIDALVRSLRVDAFLPSSSALADAAPIVGQPDGVRVVVSLLASDLASDLTRIEAFVRGKLAATIARLERLDLGTPVERASIALQAVRSARGTRGTARWVVQAFGCLGEDQGPLDARLRLMHDLADLAAATQGAELPAAVVRHRILRSAMEAKELDPDALATAGQAAAAMALLASGTGEMPAPASAVEVDLKNLALVVRSAKPVEPAGLERVRAELRMPDLDQEMLVAAEALVAGDNVWFPNEREAMWAYALAALGRLLHQDGEQAARLLLGSSQAAQAAHLGSGRILELAALSVWLFLAHDPASDEIAEAARQMAEAAERLLRPKASEARKAVQVDRLRTALSQLAGQVPPSSAEGEALWSRLRALEIDPEPVPATAVSASLARLLEVRDDDPAAAAARVIRRVLPRSRSVFPPPSVAQLAQMRRDPLSAIGRIYREYAFRPPPVAAGVWTPEQWAAVEDEMTRPVPSLAATLREFSLHPEVIYDEVRPEATPARRVPRRK